jgi:hypothetical protein
MTISDTSDVIDSYFLCTLNTEINKQVIAQPIQNPFPNNTETAERFPNFIEGNDTAIITK